MFKDAVCPTYLVHINSNENWKLIFYPALFDPIMGSHGEACDEIHSVSFFDRKSSGRWVKIANDFIEILREEFPNAFIVRRDLERIVIDDNSYFSIKLLAKEQSLNEWKSMVSILSWEDGSSWEVHAIDGTYYDFITALDQANKIWESRKDIFVTKRSWPDA